jgi:hypothetical protein
MSDKTQKGKKDGRNVEGDQKRETYLEGREKRKRRRSVERIECG